MTQALPEAEAHGELTHEPKPGKHHRKSQGCEANDAKQGKAQLERSKLWPLLCIDSLVQQLRTDDTQAERWSCQVYQDSSHHDAPLPDHERAHPRFLSRRDLQSDMTLPA